MSQILTCLSLGLPITGMRKSVVGMRSVERDTGLLDLQAVGAYCSAYKWHVLTYRRGHADYPGE